jgi:outer membrane cobalamin receptor
MKTRILILTGILALAAGSGCTTQKNATETTGQHYDHLTGSYLPQDVDRNGPVSNGKSNVQVLDRSDIDNSGATDVNQTLRKSGVR